MSVVIAWGQPVPFSLQSGPPDAVLWGCEGELLPGGTMFCAQATLHCVVGKHGTINEIGNVVVSDNADLNLYGIRGTDTEELLPYKDEILSSLRQLREAIA